MISVRPPRKDLPPIPVRMRSLPIESRGYPVPWFVQWINGAPDFRVMDRRKWGQAVRYGNCWLCGEPVGRFKTFVIGPMCGINRTTSEPPNHFACAEFAAIACPFMTLPKAQYRKTDFEHIEPAGMPIFRNPGVTCLWTTRDFRTFRTGGDGPGNPGQLIHIGDPESVGWFAEGRPATRAEVLASIESGLPLLEAPAREQDVAEHRGSECLDALRQMVMQFMQYLPT